MKHIIALIILTASILAYNNIININLETIIFVTLLIVISTSSNKHEYMTDLEAISALSSVYNTGSATLTNLTLTGDLTVNGKTIAGDLQVTKNALLNGNVNIGGNAAIDGTTTYNAADKICAFVYDGGAGAESLTPLVVGSGSFADLTSPNTFNMINREDGVILAPGYGIKMWNKAPPAPNYDVDPPDMTAINPSTNKHWRNISSKDYNVGAGKVNIMDYFKVYKL